jgi:hypothetical protein
VSISPGESFERLGRASRDGSATRASCETPPHLYEGLALLLQAHEYARQLNQDAWEFAVELPVLRAAKLTNSDLRWLVAMGYVEHAVETTGPSDRARQFRRTPLVSFSEAACLVLTASGVSVAQESCGREAVVALNGNGAPLANCRIVPEEETLQRPTWDDQRRQLRVGAEIVKEFKLPSPNQETVLMAFEEEGWPPRIDDPLPPLPQLDPRRRLHDTIKALNRKQRNFRVRFMGDGSGEGIRWEFIAEQASLGEPSIAAG